MQKILNIIFILALVVIAAIVPLNTALLNINIFGPIIDKPGVTNPSKTIEEVVFEKFEVLGADENGLNPSEIVLSYSSNTGEFGAKAPAFALRISDASGAEEKLLSIDPSQSDLNALGNFASYTIKIADISEALADGYHTFTLLDGGGTELYRFTVSKNTAITKKLLRYSSELPEGYKQVIYFFPDSSFSKAIPVSRLERAGVFDYVAMYNTLRLGAAEGLGLKENPAVAFSGYYWVADGAVKVDYLSTNLSDFPNIDTMYEAVANTFARYGEVKKANFNIDGQASKSLEMPLPPYIYLPFENESDYIYIYYEAAETDSISALIAKFTNKMYDTGLLPPMTKLTNCELSSDGALKIEYKDYHLTENREIFEVLLNLTAFSHPEVKELSINGSPAQRIILYNLEK